MKRMKCLGLLAFGLLAGPASYSSVIEVFTETVPNGTGGNGAFVNWDNKTPPSDYTNEFGEGVAASSPIGTGAAVQQWDHNNINGRALFRYDFETPITEAFQFEFTALLDSSLSPAGANRYVSFGFGNAGQSVEAGSTRQGFEYRFYPNGDLGLNGPTAATNLGLDTVHSLAVILNTSTTSSVDYNVNGNPVSLAAASYAVYLDGAHIQTDVIRVDQSNWIIANGFGRVAVATDLGSGLNLAPTMFYDDLYIKTGADIGITAVPEPTTTSLVLGLLVFSGLIARRRIRRS